MIIIKNFPFPPSANEMYATNVHKFKSGAIRTSKRRSKILEFFYEQCDLFEKINKKNIDAIKAQLNKWIAQGQVLGMDCYVVVEHSRVWTKDGNPQQFDADNRRKALQDGICEILGIDDKYVFRGITEKVTCNRKDSECSIIKIYPMQGKSLQNLNL